MKTGIGFTHFHLVYGKEALLPLEKELRAMKKLEKMMDVHEDMLFERFLYLQEV